MATTKIEGNKCPNCGKLQDLSTGIDNGATPKPDDISVCIGCIAICKYNKDLKLVLLTKKELEELKKEEIWPVIKELQVTVIASVWKSRFGLGRLN